MQKSIHRPHHQRVYARLREAREQAELTQVQMAVRLKTTQAWVSSVETGLTRLDLVQVWEWCRACGTTLTAFAAQVEADFEVLPPESPKKSDRVAKSTKRKSDK